VKSACIAVEGLGLRVGRLDTASLRSAWAV